MIEPYQESIKYENIMLLTFLFLNAEFFVVILSF